jgi:phosphatidylserine decarboxylase
MGAVSAGMALQAKGMAYPVADLLGSPALAERYTQGQFITLRLTSAMYHHFHAPADLQVERVHYISGDTWNVNPIALQRVERLFCRNERAVLHTRLARGGHDIALVPVAAILVASMRFHFLDVLLHLRYRGPHELPCEVEVSKGQELGWFQHGSTIIVFAPPGFRLAPNIAEGQHIRMGQPLMLLPDAADPQATGTVTVV